MKSVVVCVVVAMVGNAAAQPGMTQPNQPASAPATPVASPSASAPAAPVTLSVPMAPSAPTASTAPLAPHDRPAQVRVSGELSEDSMVSLSLGATLVSWSVIGVGAVSGSGKVALLGGVGALIGPSFGTWRAGGSSLPWMGMRLAGLATMFWGVTHALNEGDDECDFDCTNTSSSNGDTAVGAALLGGLGLFIAGSIIDIATAPAAARQHNRELHQLTVTPMVHPGGTGLMLGGRF